MTQPRIVHLVDDTTAGGVMRVLDHILTAPAMAQTGLHSRVCVARGRVSLQRVHADVVVSHLAISWRALPMLVALRVRHPTTPIVHVEHSYTEGFVRANVANVRRFGVLLKTAYRLFNRVVAVSKAQGRWLVQSGAVRPSALKVIQSCVELSAFRALRPARPQVRVIGAIGRLDRQKGFDTLITAFRGITDACIELHIFGEGDEMDTLRNLAGNDPRIRFMGFSKDPVAAMAGVDAVAMPSVWEAYGLVAIETLAAGRALLVNNVDGLTDHVPHGARVVWDAQPTTWQKALGRLITRRRPAKIKTLSREAYEDAFAAQWRQMLDDVMREEFAHKPVPALA
ncbi:MAG: glycosyltransferase [Marivita sp.]|uniref:glycosyltransferase n=1 Tax=Marivita sp. TaxID=2003365 RepID=UPI003EFA0140